MDIEKLIEQVNARGLGNGTSLGYHSGLFDEAATALSMLQAENEKLRAELGQVKRERDAAVKDIIGLLYHADDSELVDIHQLELHIRERKEHNEL